VIGIAFIQATLVGIALLIAGIPWAGVLALIVLVLGVAQVPASLVILPCIAYLWMGGDYSIGESIGYTLLLAVCSSADNVLKPLLLGRGVDAPMPIILIGALGGLANSGFLGLFLGATLLALGYNLFMGWVELDPDNEPPPVPPVIR
jgi:predicted PurR-regulated permease PerM